MEVVATAQVPPSVGVLILEAELSEGKNRVLERGSAERGTLEITIFDVDVIVVLWVALTADHGEDEYVLVIDCRISNFEPKLNGVFSGPFLERRRIKANVAFWRVQLSRHMPIIASNSVKHSVLV